MRKRQKNILTVTMLVTLLLISSLVVFAQDDKVSPKGSVVGNDQESLLIGKIISHKNSSVLVKGLMGYDGEIVIHITDQTAFPNGAITDYPEGYLITAYYDGSIMESFPPQINASSIAGVEEDGKVSICSVP